MIFTLSANIKLLSVNKAFVTLRNGVRCRSKDYLTFSCAIGRLLNQNRKSFLEFNDYFDPYKHEVHGSLIYYTNDLFTKDGRISQKSGDLGNFEKCLTDCVLIGKVDDSSITRWFMEKKEREIKGFEVSYKIIERDRQSLIIN